MWFVCRQINTLNMSEENHRHAICRKTTKQQMRDRVKMHFVAGHALCNPFQSILS